MHHHIPLAAFLVEVNCNMARTGQNPTGATLPLEQRQVIYAITQKYDLIILEDGKYTSVEV